MTPEEKRKLYFEAHPEVYKHYIDVKNNLGGGITVDDIKCYAIENTEFYKNYKVGDTFPVMDKMAFIKNHDAIKSREVFDKPLHVSSTSGSTGTPFKVEQDSEKRSRTIADLKVFGELALYNSHEKMLQLRSYVGKPLDRKIDEAENIWRYDIFGLNEDKIQDLIDFILQYKPVIVFGYVSTLDTICSYILKSGKTYDFGVRSVLVGAEALTDEIAGKMQQVFKCPVFDRYSNMEMGILAQREYGKTFFKVNRASYDFECLKLDSDEWAEEGEVGRLVFTDLYNHVFPMIRYDTGDLGTYVKVNGEVFIKEVYGRKIDQINDVDGKFVEPVNIINCMWNIQGVLQWQFIQKDKGVYLFKIIPIGDGPDIAELISRAKKVVGDSAKIKVEKVHDLPVLNSQKRKSIVNEYKK